MTATTEAPRTNGYPVSTLAPVRPAAETAGVPVISAATVTAAQEQVRLQAEPALVEQWDRDDLHAERSVAAQVREMERQLHLRLAEAGMRERERLALAELAEQQKVREAQLAEGQRKTLADLANAQFVHEAKLRRERRVIEHEEKLADEGAADALWQARVDRMKRRVTSASSMLADWVRATELMSRILVVATVVFMGVSAVVMQDGLAKGEPDMGPLMYVVSYGLETAFSIALAVVMMLASELAKRGRKVNLWLIVPVELAIVSFSIVMTTVPRMGHATHAWIFAAAPVGVTVLLGVHTALTLAKMHEMRRSATEAGEELRRAIQIIDPHTIELVAYAEQAREGMDAGLLTPSQDANGAGAPSATGLVAYFRMHRGVTVHKGLAGEIRDVMKVRLQSSNQ